MLNVGQGSPWRARFPFYAGTILHRGFASHVPSFVEAQISRIATSDQPVSQKLPVTMITQSDLVPSQTPRWRPQLDLDCRQLLSMRSIVSVWEANIFLRAAPLR